MGEETLTHAPSERATALAAGFHALADAALGSLFDYSRHPELPARTQVFVSAPDDVERLAARHGAEVDRHEDSEGCLITSAEISFGPPLPPYGNPAVVVSVVHIAPAVTR